ncbi:hypothetical protein EI168_01460 [Halomonas sp. FME1]|uniref:Uncharacterized protein n=1 Tax=Halomonas casei TaxID=2742613 RepID=A0ABR9EX25_9GAMM|nr:hypothetical protein [Halomonas casei]MBE0398777.1 hypothetical protein [Halomonas casei]
MITTKPKAIGRLVPLLLLLGGCSSSMGPMSWDTGYHATGVDDTTEQGLLLAPHLCHLPAAKTGIVTLPPGCANDLNLQYMVERPQDLLHGRDMGPPSAEPLARAARERLSNREHSQRRRQRLEEKVRGGGSYATTSDM